MHTHPKPIHSKPPVPEDTLFEYLKKIKIKVELVIRLVLLFSIYLIVGVLRSSSNFQFY